MKLTFSQKLTFGQFFTIILFIIFALINLTFIYQIKYQNIFNLNDTFQYYRLNNQIKYEVVQIQQYLTDASATKIEDGLDDGPKLAEEHYQLLQKNIEEEIILATKDNNQKLVEDLNKIKEVTKKYYETGKTMSELYIKEGTKAGNKYMEVFDKASEDLQNNLTPIIDHYNKSFENEITSLNKKIDFLFQITIWIPLLVLAIYFIFNFVFVKNLNANLKIILKGLVDNSSDLESASLSLNQESSSLANSSTEQANAIESSSTSLHQMVSTIQSNADFSEKAKDKTEESVRVTQNGIKTLNNVLKAIDDISQNNISVIEEMQTTNKEVSQIVNVIEEIENKTKIINDIVFQTKLLSFNASVEAGRAGEAGKGFAVVAEEVANLSNVSGQAAKDISILLNQGVSKIKGIVDQSNKKVDFLSHEGKNKVESSMMVINESKEVLDSILSNVETIKSMVNEIAVSSSQQSGGMQEISAAFSQIEVSTREQSLIAEYSSTQSTILKEQSEKLAVVIQNFLHFIEGDNFKISTFEWNKRYVLDVPSMDDEHQILITKMNQFLISLNGKNLKLMIDNFNDLAEYTVKHFKDEEEYMDFVGYPGIEEHKKIHQDLVSKVVAYGENLKKGKVEKQMISNFLKNWLALHIVGQDRKYSTHSHMKNNRRAK